MLKMAMTMAMTMAMLMMTMTMTIMTTALTPTIADARSMVGPQHRSLGVQHHGVLQSAPAPWGAAPAMTTMAVS